MPHHGKVSLEGAITFVDRVSASRRDLTLLDESNQSVEVLVLGKHASSAMLKLGDFVSIYNRKVNRQYENLVTNDFTSIEQRSGRSSSSKVSGAFASRIQ
jgi:hypothetical protein